MMVVALAAAFALFSSLLSSPASAHSGESDEGKPEIAVDGEAAAAYLEDVIEPLVELQPNVQPQVHTEQEMLRESKRLGMTPALTGKAVPNGYVVAELLPSSSEREKLESGDSYHGVIVAAAKANGASDYRMSISSGDARLASTGDQSGGTQSVWLTFLDADGLLVGADLVNLSADGELVTASLSGASVSADNPWRGSVNSDLDQAPTGDEVVDFHEGWCHWYVVDHDWADVSTTLAVTGTNTSAATYEVNITSSQSSKLGVAVNVGVGWTESSGGVTMSNVAGTGLKWNARSDYGTYSYRTNVEYALEQYDCYSGTQTRLVPHDSTGARFNPVKWGTTQYPEYCVFQAGNGSFTLNRSTATNWNGGVKLSNHGIGLNVDAQTGYSDSAKITHNYSRNAYLCGRNANPGSSSTPGYIISDWKDRG